MKSHERDRRTENKGREIVEMIEKKKNAIEIKKRERSIYRDWLHMMPKIYA